MSTLSMTTVCTGTKRGLKTSDSDGLHMLLQGKWETPVIKHVPFLVYGVYLPFNLSSLFLSKLTDPVCDEEHTGQG